MPLSAGDKLGPYEILGLIGAGGMGEVYKARDPRVGRDVAIKVAKEHFSERFEREARVIAALNHPNICTLHDVGPNYLVMEYVEGRAPKGPLPLKEALRVAGQIASALEAAHQKGIVHRDLKPANLKITAAGLVKVLDFGLAKNVGTPVADGSTITMGLTEVGTALGTPAYMAPEQAEGNPTDNRADVWAFGVVLYELLTGYRPFKGDGVQATLAAVLTKEPDLEKAPFPVRRLLSACFAKIPLERLSAIGDWQFLLDEGPSSHGGATQARSRSKIAWAVASVVALIGAALVAFNLLHSGPAAIQPRVTRFAVPIPGGIGSDVMFALSPDGRNLAISAAEDGKFRLRVRPLDELEARLLSGADGARFPFWSPDGKQLGFFAEGKLKTILVGSGEPTTVTDVEASLLGGTWGRDGVIVFSQSRQLYSVEEKGGKPKLLYGTDRQILYNPEFLPDGRHFLYVSDGVYLGSLDAAAPVRLLPDVARVVYSPAGYLLIARQGRLTAQPFDAVALKLSGTAIPITRDPVMNSLLAPMLSAAEGGTLAYQSLVPEQLAWVDRRGMVKERVGSPQLWSNFRLSLDQTKVACDTEQGGATSSDIAVFDLRRGTQERLRSGGIGALVPVFSPDGTQIAFTSRRTGRFNPYIADASHQSRLVADMGLNGGYPVDWSPDGRNLLWWGDEDLWIIPVSGEGKPYPFAQSPFEERSGSFSPDGHWIAYASNVSGRYEIYLQSFPAEGRKPDTVSVQGGSRRDGKELYYVAGDGRLTAIPLAIRGSDVQFGRPESLLPVKSSDFGRAYEPAIDGQRFLVTMPAAAGQAAITVMLNWQAALKN